VNVRAVAARDVERRRGIWMRDVFASEKGEVTVCAVDIFLYGAGDKVSESSGAVCQRKIR